MLVGDAAVSLASRLEAAGHVVERADMGMEALNTVSAFHAQLVLCDDSLPDMSVRDLCLGLHESPATAALPVVLLGSGAAADYAARLPIAPSDVQLQETMRAFA